MHKKVIMIAALLFVLGVIGSAFSAKGYFSETKSELAETEFALDKVNDISINSDVSTIELLPSDSDTILVESFYGKNQKPAEVTVKQDTLRIKVEQKQAFYLGFNWNNSNHSKIKIYLPKKKYENITLNNDVGSTELEAIELKKLVIDTAAGSVKLDQISTDKMDISSGVGSIVVKESTGNMDLNSSTGAIKVETDALKNNLYATTEVGAIKIRTKQKPKDIFITAYSKVGSTRILGEKTTNYKDGNNSYEVKLNSETGSIKVIQD